MFPIKNAVPTRYPPVVTWALIAANCLVFFVQLGLSPREEELFLIRFALIPARYFGLLPVGSALYFRPLDRRIIDPTLLLHAYTPSLPKD